MMPSPEVDARIIRLQLERVLASDGFSRNERISRFLRFIVERRLEGREGELKETVIAVEVFGRQPDYNPKRDAIVRTEAGRLRSKLSDYYLSKGAGDSLVIELPKGAYIPAFHQLDTDTVLVRSPQRRFPIGLVTLIGGALILAVGLVWWLQGKRVPITIAVLPLENLTHDPADEYLADGLTDELIRTLSTFDGLSPRSRTSSFALKGKAHNVHQVGAELSVDYIVEGSVLRSGDQLRVDAQLVRVRDDVSLWSGKFERRNSDVLAIQDEIARTIVNNLPIRLGYGRKRREVIPEAYDLYLRAQGVGFQDRIALYHEAVAKDPSFALAYAGMAAAFAYRTGNAASDVISELPEMRAAAQKAVELDPLLPEAHSALGIAYARDAEWNLAEKSFRRAIDLNPNASQTCGDYSVYVLLEENKIGEALEQMRIAEKSDPMSPEVRSELAYVLLAAHRYDEAATQCERLPDDCHCWPAPREPMRNECLGRARLGQGRLSEAIALLADGTKDALPGAPIRGYLAYAYGLASRRYEARQIIDADWKNPYHQALGFAGLGDRNSAIAAMLRMAVQGPTRLGVALVVPELDSIRDDRQMQSLRKQVGLP